MDKQQHLHGVFYGLVHINIVNVQHDDMHNNLTLQEQSNTILRKQIEKMYAIREAIKNYIYMM